MGCVAVVPDMLGSGIYSLIDFQDAVPSRQCFGIIAFGCAQGWLFFFSLGTTASVDKACVFGSMVLLTRHHNNHFVH